MHFNINAPFWRFMDTLLRFTGLNLVYLITMVPVITIGPARAALYSTMFAYDEHDDIPLVKEYLKRFKREFKQGVVSWIILAALAAVIVFGIVFWAVYDSNVSYVPLVIFIIAAVVVVMIAEYLFPMQARFVNTIGTEWRLAALFPWRAWPATLALLCIDVIALGIAFYVPFIRVLALIFGVAWVAYAKSLLLLRAFKRYGQTGPVEEPTFVNAHD